MSGHMKCAEFMFDAANAPSNPTHDLSGAMAVSENYPSITAPEFPVQTYRCPHGVRFHCYPTPERIQALRDLNAATPGGTP